MNHREWAIVVETYNAFWPKGPLTRGGGVDAWYRVLGRHNQHDVLEALTQLAENAIYPPAAAEIKDLLRTMLRRRQVTAPALPRGDVSEGRIIWQRLSTEQRRECLQAAIEDGVRDGWADDPEMSKLAGTVDDPSHLLLLGGRHHATQRYLGVAL